MSSSSSKRKHKRKKPSASEGVRLTRCKNRDGQENSCGKGEL